MNLEKIKKNLRDLCFIPGLSGYEDDVRKYLSEQLSSLNLENKTDVLGNLICTIPGDNTLPSVMLFAHMDQLGFVVKKIEDDGFIRIDRLGGVPEKSLPSQEVVIKTNQGNSINAIIGNKSHHATSNEEKHKVISYKDLFIDAGFLSKDEALQNGINIGSPITYSPSFKEIGQHCISATAIDDRAGCAVVLGVAELLQKNNKRPTVHIVFSVQEEFNLRGILPAAQILKPDIAIQIDLMLSSDTPDMHNQGDVILGKGPCMSLYSFHGRGTLNGLIPHPSLVKLFDNIASKNNIFLQRSATTGILTDSSYVQFINEGIACIDLGFPMRYSHSSKEVCDLRDLLNLGNLLFNSIISIDKNFSLERN
ncbi:MAG: putative aminopeptidase YsdC [Alphaproteobacteria bacterium MarineAlpha5_Bin8]|nr:MAG: putative aminopeptidase YsdC [Alphaproteobacteria bacterium MarineAlpha5_Bin7]PPR46263.1 MAG: putative aminopeptidase YsdC [Alphaproteobacteria bacterium MarineAlpha5_Bin8]PPR53722.1 MAG: putative aminopeptidase YsdC [Alphaproteobacteria bacterium MarineAlpha5_Bin6]|tara:strand:- start:199 stop:1293 length:1095 start_codon:yes stop_codon:yes gene_type:complete